MTKIIINSFVVVCIFIQTLTVLPHHHHDGSNLPCVNLFHCIDESVGNSLTHDHAGCQGHEAQNHDQNCRSEGHRHDGNGVCSFEHMDVIRPTRDEIGKVFIADFLFYGILGIGDSQTSDRSRHESQMSLLADKRYIGAPPLHSQYIVQAIPPRAPSFTA